MSIGQTLGENSGDDDDGALRALRIIEALSSMEQPAGLRMIAWGVGLNKMKTYRALEKLVAAGYVDHVGRSGYRIGSRSVALGSLIGPRPALVQRARPVLVRLAGVTSEFTTLHMRSGSHRVLVLKVVNQATPFEVTIGERAPLTSGCSGLAILAQLPEQEISNIVISRPPGVPRPSKAMLDQIRTDGYATSFESNHPGLHGIAAPILDPESGYPLGAIAVSGSANRLTAELLRTFVPALTVACNELGPQLSKLLGPNASERYSALDVKVQGGLVQSYDSGYRL